MPKTSNATARRRTGKRMVGMAVLGEFETRAGGQRLNPQHIVLIRELEALLAARRRSRLVEASEEEGFLRAAAPRIFAHAGAESGLEAVLGWARAKCPRLVAERGLAHVETIAKRYRNRAPHKAETLGYLLNVTPEEREGLGLTKIRYAGQDDGRLILDRRARKAAAEKARRQKSGAKPRELSASKTEPWIAAGFKTRRTWERHGKPEAKFEAVSQKRGKQSSFQDETPLKVAVHEFATTPRTSGDRLKRAPAPRSALATFNDIDALPLAALAARELLRSRLFMELAR